MEVLVGLVALIFIILTLKWVGAWMLGVTNVLDKQDKIIGELQKMNMMLSKNLKDK